MSNHKSQKVIWITIALFGLVMLLSTSACQSTGDEVPTAPEIVQGFLDTLNAGDVEGSLAFLADDAVIQFVPPAIPGDDGIFSGKEEIRGWYENLTEGHGSGEINNVRVDGEQVTALLTFSDDGLKQLGLDSIDNEWVVTVKDGKIQGYTSTMTEESLEQLMAALANAQAE